MKKSLPAVLTAIVLLLAAFIPVAHSQVQPKTSEASATRLKDGLIRFIHDKQQDKVKLSVDDDDCFTEEDYKVFSNSHMVDRVKADIDSDHYFLALKSDIARLDVIDINAIYSEGRAAYKRTWKENGHKGADGQTKYGSLAEKEIAVAIVERLQQLVDLQNAQPKS